MTMSLDNTIDQLLRGSEVSSVRVYKCSGVQVVDFERDGKLGVGRNGIEVRGGLEFACWLPTTR